jgi:hypothetical protein
MRRTSLLTVVIVSLAARTAAATCVKNEDGCAVCCSGPDHCSTSCPKPVIEWRPADGSGRFELSAGVVAATMTDAELDRGGRVSVGYHRLFANREWVSGKSLWMFGNELGAELGAERIWIDGAAETQLSVTPILRVARASRWRTPSVFGVVLPEVGASLRPGLPSQIYFRWSVFPVDVLVVRRLAITIDPLEAAVGIGGGTRWWLSSSIGLRVVM